MPRKRSSKANVSNKPVIKLNPADEIVCIKNINDCEIVYDDHDTTNNNKIIDLTKHNNSGAVHNVLEIQDEIVNVVMTPNRDDIVCISSDDDENDQNLDNEYLVEMNNDKKRVEFHTISRRKKHHFGFSEFEFIHDTKLLDKYFIQKKLPTIIKKRKRDYETVMVDENISFKGNFMEEVNSEYFEFENETEEENCLDLTNHKVFLVKTRNNNEDADCKDIKDHSEEETLESSTAAELKEGIKRDKQILQDSDPEPEEVLVTSSENLEKLLGIAFNELEVRK